MSSGWVRVGFHYIVCPLVFLIIIPRIPGHIRHTLVSRIHYIEQYLIRAGFKL